MTINYTEIFNKNMQNVLRDVLINFTNKKTVSNNHLYITFKTKKDGVKMPKWLKDKHPDEMTIVIQYEYWDLKILKNSFSIMLSFNKINTKIVIPFNAVSSFADPFANFGLKFNKTKDEKKQKSLKKINKNRKIIKLDNYRKN